MKDKITFPIRVEAARGILKKKGEGMSDKQIEALLTTLRLICDKAIDSALKNNYSK